MPNEPDGNRASELRQPLPRFVAVKRALMYFGSLFSARTLERLETPLNFLWLGNWIKAQGFAAVERKTAREELFQDLALQLGNRKVLYLEFGVAHGDSMRYWATLLSNPESCLDGFDTFEGLPFDWKPGLAKGAFSNQGEVPQIADPRVHFFKGLFDQTLPHYQLPAHDVMVVNIDCDLYSSAFYVLSQLAPHLAAGDFIYFDEFDDRRNELRAFSDFLAASKLRFRLTGATKLYRHVVFERLA
jgi:hypothetical protein